MRIELPVSVKRHARRFAVITLLSHRTAKSQTELDGIFEAYIDEFISALQGLGATPDKAIEIALALSSKTLDIMASKMNIENESDSRE